jgi:hypothetical protein
VAVIRCGKALWRGQSRWRRRYPVALALGNESVQGAQAAKLIRCAASRAWTETTHVLGGESTALEGAALGPTAWVGWLARLPSAIAEL